MPKKILIVDDSALMRRVLSDIIDSDKRFILSDAAGNGLEAYDLITTNPGKYDLLVLDINMPKMNGIQLLEKLNEKKIHIPTIMVSSIAKEGAVETISVLNSAHRISLRSPITTWKRRAKSSGLRLSVLWAVLWGFPSKQERFRRRLLPQNPHLFRQYLLRHLWPAKATRADRCLT